MFKSLIFSCALVSVDAWHRNVKQDKFQTEAYGVDNQYYGTQGYGGKGGLGHGGNAAWNQATSHNSYRQSGHQGQGHNQWVDNAWNQWGTNNHYDTQKAVDNKWGNQSGKINVTLNSVSGHYDKDYGQQQRGMGYEGHQNVSGEIGYTIGLGGHSFGYAEGTHSFGYDNADDYGYGGWANNLGAFNHGANYDNFGNQFQETGRDQYNDARDTSDVKENRRVGAGYGDNEELDADDDRQDQYANTRINVTNRRSGTRNTLDLFAGRGAVRSAGQGVAVGDWTRGDIYDAQRGYGGVVGFGSGFGRGGYGYSNKLDNGVAEVGDESNSGDKAKGGLYAGYGVLGLGRGYGYGSGAQYGAYGIGLGARGLGAGLGARGLGAGYGTGYGYGQGRPLGGSNLGRPQAHGKW